MCLASVSETSWLTFDQNVPDMRLLHGRQGAAAALGDQLDDMKAVGAAQDRRHFADFQLGHDLRKNAGQAIERAHAEASTLQAVRRIRVSRGQLGEIFALAEATENLVGFGLEFLDLLRARRLRRAQENVRDFVFLIGGPLARVAAQIVVDFAFRNQDLVFHLALAHAGDGHFLADVLAELAKFNTILLDRIAKLRHRHFVAASNPLQRLFELCILDAQAALPRILQLDLVHHQALEHLAFEDIARRQGGALPPQLADGHIQTGAQFDEGDHFVIDDRDNTIGGLRLPARAARRLRANAGDAAKRKKQRAKQ